MTILVTRPDQAGIDLTAALSAAGHATIHAPLFTLTAGSELNLLPAAFSRLSADDWIIAASKYAVSYAEQTVAQIGGRWPLVQYAAVGRSTALHLQQACEQPVLFPTCSETSEGLLELSALHSMNGRRVLILRGNSGRPLLAKVLQDRGADVNFCECYQRINLEYDGAQHADVWQRANVNLLVITSGDILQQLVALVPDTAHPWLTSCRLVVVSKRIAAMARAYGWQEIVISDRADNRSLIAAVEQFE